MRPATEDDSVAVEPAHIRPSVGLAYTGLIAFLESSELMRSVIRSRVSLSCFGVEIFLNKYRPAVEKAVFEERFSHLNKSYSELLVRHATTSGDFRVATEKLKLVQRERDEAVALNTISNAERQGLMADVYRLRYHTFRQGDCIGKIEAILIGLGVEATPELGALFTENDALEKTVLADVADVWNASDTPTAEAPVPAVCIDALSTADVFVRHNFLTALSARAQGPSTIKVGGLFLNPLDVAGRLSNGVMSGTQLGVAQRSLGELLKCLVSREREASNSAKTLRVMLSESTERCTALQSAKDELSEARKKLKHEITALTSKNKATTEKFREELRVAQERGDAAHAPLKARLDVEMKASRLREERINADAENIHLLRTEIGSVRGELTEALAASSMIDTVVAEGKRKIAQLEATVAHLKADARAAEQGFAAMTDATNKKHDAVVRGLGEEIKFKQGALDSLEKENTRIMAESLAAKSSLADDVARVTNDLAQTRGELAGAKADLDLARAKAKELGAELAARTADLAKTAAELKKTTTELGRTSTELDKSKSGKTFVVDPRHARKVTALQEEKRGLEKTCADLQKRADGAELERSKLEETVQILQGRINIVGKLSEIRGGPASDSGVDEELEPEERGSQEEEKYESALQELHKHVFALTIRLRASETAYMTVAKRITGMDRTLTTKNEQYQQLLSQCQQQMHALQQRQPGQWQGPAAEEELEALRRQVSVLEVERDAFKGLVTAAMGRK